MFTRLLRWSIALALAVAAFGFYSTPLPAHAHAINSSHSSHALASTSGNCVILAVQLHGKDKYSVTCLSRLGSATPYSITGNNPCNSDDLYLYINANYGGAFLLCISGNGLLNLSGFCFDYTCGWDNSISSYKSGKWDGLFGDYSNIGGNTLGFYPNETCPNLGYTHHDNNGISNWNDKISSIEIWGTFTASPETC